MIDANDMKKIQDMTRIIDHINDCIRDATEGIDIDVSVLTGAIEDNTETW